jgi:hypothetical protein
MRLLEFSSIDRNLVNTAELTALSQFLLSRADDTAAKNVISVGAFVKLAADMGISITADQLTQLSQQEPLSNVIASVNNGEIVFKGDEDPSETMTVDQARDTVDRMAKRAIR